MVGSRTATAIAGLVGSVLVSLAAWWYFNTLLVFLVVPFVPILLRRGSAVRRPPRRQCPACGFATREPEFDYCPRDGTSLE